MVGNGRQTIIRQENEGRFGDMPVTKAHELFLHEVGDIYDAEHRFLEGQQEMVQNATDEEFRGAIQEHIQQTRQHIVNLERVFEELGEERRRETCDASQGLVNEARKGVAEAGNGTVRDCVIVAAVAKVEHYEIAGYRNLITGAQLMGHTGVERLLRENLRQEEETARIAEQSAEKLLRKAMQEEGGQEEGERPEEEKGLIDKAKDRFTGQ